jgi:hypothetical protein
MRKIQQIIAVDGVTNSWGPRLSHGVCAMHGEGLWGGGLMLRCCGVAVLRRW